MSDLQPEGEIPAEEALLPPAEAAEGQEHQAEPTLDAPADPPRQTREDRRVQQLLRERSQLREQLERERAAKEPEPKAPDPADFETDAAYIDAAIDFRARKIVREEAEQGQRRQAEHAQKQTLETVWDKGREKHHDFDEVVIDGAKNDDWHCSPIMAEEIKTSEKGADLAYYLATHPEESVRIASLGPSGQARALDQITKSLGTTSRPPPPPPPNTLRGTGGVSGDQHLARLESEADRTGDRTAVIAYRRSLREQATAT